MTATEHKHSSRTASQDGQREAAVAESGQMPPTAAAPSPFTPIANHLGNFPQAFSHLALVEAAARLIVAETLAEVAG